jgi:hypothetical protein
MREFQFFESIIEKINYHTRYTKFVRGEIFILYLPSYEGKELGEM